MKRMLFLLFLGMACGLANAQTWNFSSNLDDYAKEGWYMYSAPRIGSEFIQNQDGTVTIKRLEANSQTIYLTHDVSWVEPTDPNVEKWSFTYELRVRVDKIGMDGTREGDPDPDYDRASLYPLKNKPDGTKDTYSNGRTWLCSFDQESIGSRYFATDTLPKAQVDFTQFHVLTFVCSLDYVKYNDKVTNFPDINFGNGFEGDEYPDRALGDHSPWTLYIDRKFDKPAIEDMPGSGWDGWGPPAVDADGIMQIGFQGNTRGQITVDYFRTGNGVILDPNEPKPTRISSWELW